MVREEEETEDAAADHDDSVRSAASGGSGKAACHECGKEFASKQVSVGTKCNSPFCIS